MDSCYAIIGDIHANLEALEAVLDDARSQGVTDFYCLGDVVGYNANPHECIAKIRELDCATVRGNHDHYCSHNESLDDFQPNAANVIAWTRRLLSDEDEKWLHDLPLSIVMPGITLVHGTLDMPERWGYVWLQEEPREFGYPALMDAEKLLWTVFYAQEEHFSKTGKYMKDVPLSAKDRELMPDGATLGTEVWPHGYKTTMLLPGGNSIAINEAGKLYR